MLAQQTVTRTTARRKFGGYKKEEPKAVRQAKASKLPDEIIKIWERYISEEIITGIGAVGLWSHSQYGLVVNSNYDDVGRLIGDLRFPAKEIEKFASLLGPFQEEEGFAFKAGVFLSALVNRSRSRKFALDFSRLRITVSDFGYLNKKRVTINGNLGSSAGWGMEGGSIIVNGNAGDFVGFCMNDGILVVNGNAGKGVGERMGNGEIRLNGSYESIGYNPHDGSGSLGNIHGGKIFHKGKQIYP